MIRPDDYYALLQKAKAELEQAKATIDTQVELVRTWALEVDRLKSEVERHGECICNTGPGTDGPEEFCPRHGRPYNDALEYMDRIIKSDRAERADGDAQARRLLLAALDWIPAGAIDG